MKKELAGSRAKLRGLKRRHDTRLNVLFCDGHVETPRVSDPFTTRSDAILARWNNDGQPHHEMITWQAIPV
jgi:prepilin-type processing-associated H-X9-DG protein